MKFNPYIRFACTHFFAPFIHTEHIPGKMHTALTPCYSMHLMSTICIHDANIHAIKLKLFKYWWDIVAFFGLRGMNGHKCSCWLTVGGKYHINSCLWVDGHVLFRFIIVVLLKYRWIIIKLSIEVDILMSGQWPYIIIFIFHSRGCSLDSINLDRK